MDSVEEAKTEICKQIEHLERDSSDIETPISVSLDLQHLRESANPEERSRADLVSAVGDLRTGLSKLEVRTKDHRQLLNDIQTGFQRLQDRLEGSRTLEMRRDRYHPLMVRELLHFVPRSTPGLDFLIVASFFRDSVPWLYDMGVEVYRVARRGSSAEIQRAARDFKETVDFVLHGPMSDHLFDRKRDMSMIMSEIEPILDRALAML